MVKVLPFVFYLIISFGLDSKAMSALKVMWVNSQPYDVETHIWFKTLNLFGEKA